MIVCLCEGVSESEVREAIAVGATSLDRIAKNCDAGRDCGCCHEALQELLQDAQFDGFKAARCSVADCVPRSSALAFQTR